MKRSLRKKVPFEFVLEALEPLAPQTKPMFGFTGVYVGDRIVFCLNQKESDARDHGVWIATFPEHHESLRRLLPSMRSLILFGAEGVTSWQVLPAEAEGFEEEALRACELVLQGDPRIGKVPARKKWGAGRKKAASSKRGPPAKKKSKSARHKTARRPLRG